MTDGTADDGILMVVLSDPQKLAENTAVG